MMYEAASPKLSKLTGVTWDLVQHAAPAVPKCIHDDIVVITLSWRSRYPPLSVAAAKP